MKKTSKKKIKLIYIKILLIFIVSCSNINKKNITFSEKILANYPIAQNQNISLNGKWKFAITEAKKSHKIFIKSKYEPSLENPSIINVPSNWYNEGYKTIQAGIYQKYFNYDSDTQEKAIELNFKQIDYSAEIWLNSKLVHLHEGTFSPIKVDITKFIKKGKNKLVLRVDSPKEDIKNWPHNKYIINGSLTQSSNKPSGAISVIGREKNTGGITGDAFIKTYHKAKIKEFIATPKLFKNTQIAETNIELSIENLTNKTQDLYINLKLEPKNFTEKPYQTSKGVLHPSNLYKIKIKKGTSKHKFVIEKQAVMRWWINNFGNEREYKPNLYKISASILNEKKILDKKEQTIAFRNIKWHEEEKYWSLNSKKMLIKATNYQSNHWLGLSNKKTYDKDIKLLNEANINTVRIASHVENDDFYDLCDKNGILVFQSMGLNGTYEETLNVIKTIKKQTKDIIKMSNRHPSIIGFEVRNIPYEIKKLNIKKSNHLIDNIIYETIKNNDNYNRFIYNNQFISNEIIGWHKGSIKDYNKDNLKNFITFGSQSFPSIKKISHYLKAHHKKEIDKNMWRKLSYLNLDKNSFYKNLKLTKKENLKMLFSKSQNYQAILIKYTIENIRKNGFHNIAGIFLHRFIDNFDIIGFGILEKDRKKKKAFKSLKMAYQPILPYVDYNPKDKSFHLGVINDKYDFFSSAIYNIKIKKDKNNIFKKTYEIGLLSQSNLSIEKIKNIIKENGLYQINLDIKVDDKTYYNEYSILIK